MINLKNWRRVVAAQLIKNGSYQEVLDYVHRGHEFDPWIAEKVDSDKPEKSVDFAEAATYTALDIQMKIAFKGEDDD